MKYLSINLLHVIRCDAMEEHQHYLFSDIDLDYFRDFDIELDCFLTTLNFNYVMV